MEKEITEKKKKGKKKIIIIITFAIIMLILGIVAYLFFFTNLIQNKLIPKFENSSIQYAPGFDYLKAEESLTTETPIIELQTIKLSNEEMKELKATLKNIKETKKRKDFQVNAVLIINKDAKLLVGEKIGKLENKKETKYITITNSASKKINDLIEKNNKKVLNHLTFEKFVIRKNGAVITLANETNIKIVKDALPYYKINIQEEYTNYNNGYQEIIILDDSTVIYLYDNNIGYIRTNEESFYVVFPYNVKEIVESIYNKSINEK